MKEKAEKFVREIMSWNKRNTAEFPWRKTRNKYNVLIAEILLRKTTRNQVNKVYHNLITEFPYPNVLAKADTKKLKKIIKSLGMQETRTRLLKSMAEYIVNNYNGKVPNDLDKLRMIPGVGDYASNAVLCITENKPLPLVDTNTIRVMQRIFGLKTERVRARTDKKIWEFVKDLIPVKRAKEFNLAILDFGDLTCCSRNPKCDKCPITNLCTYFAV